ncbi:L,D-peptidoglycan transpeptidase YkuD (ErfK/YbiS/YcfS/YnhG family) [Ciceribacter lividus]|uniref:L,D-peptidoglycan transpeptidase YkuD (ErfK/YbiS/YcfS/YnhG family) n=1 Tax=Ciceribacter lividus TaxID=1197950 RepID=A0A6I7HQ03_9HYPH|nr:L,D-peptidoglycan transpeptidase YkuD (ErfK/YbiS/YcfS/YnhG family) [Ciceribacter lividus]
MKSPLRKQSAGRGQPVVLRTAPGDHSRAVLQFGVLRLPAALGRAGTVLCKKEGDGGSPRAAMRLLGGYIRGDRIRNLVTPLPMTRTKAGMLWCDEPGHPAYNRPVSAPFAASHERLMRDDSLYDICLIMDWNVTSRRRGRGSAIFFHLARPGYTPTEGCIAIARRDMLRLIRHFRCGTRIHIL